MIGDHLLFRDFGSYGILFMIMHAYNFRISRYSLRYFTNTCTIGVGLMWGYSFHGLKFIRIDRLEDVKWK
jgi:hypothetical protein